ncbi:hypothetical protein [Thalassiella azotivora]
MAWGAVVVTGWASVGLYESVTEDLAAAPGSPATPSRAFEDGDLDQVLGVVNVVTALVAALTLVLSLVALAVARRAGWFRPLPALAQGTLAWLCVQVLLWTLLQLVVLGLSVAPSPAGWLPGPYG